VRRNGFGRSARCQSPFGDVPFCWSAEKGTGTSRSPQPWYSIATWRDEPVPVSTRREKCRLERSESLQSPNTVRRRRDSVPGTQVGSITDGRLHFEGSAYLIPELRRADGAASNLRDRSGNRPAFPVGGWVLAEITTLPLIAYAGSAVPTATPGGLIRSAPNILLNPRGKNPSKLLVVVESIL